MILVWLMAIPFIGGFLCWQGERFGRGFPRWVGLITMSIVLGLSIYLWLSGDYSQTLLNPASPKWVAEFKADWIPRLGISFHLALDGLSLVLMETLADYGTVQYFGVSAFTTGIFRTWFGLGSLTAAAQLAAVLLIFILFLVMTENWSRQKARYHHTSNKYSRLPQIPLTGWKRVAAMIYCFLPVLLGFLIAEGVFITWLIWSFSRSLRFFSRAICNWSFAPVSVSAAMAASRSRCSICNCASRLRISCSVMPPQLS